MSIVLNIRPGVQSVHADGQQKTFLPFSHGRDLVAFHSTGFTEQVFIGSGRDE